MRTNREEFLISYLIPSLVRREVLASLLLDDRSWHPRELSRVLGLSNSAVALELKHLQIAGIANSRRSGNQSRYWANQESPVYKELRDLMVKTAGVADLLRVALAPFSQSNELVCAYIFGSFADARQRAGSDVDLMLVGRLSLESAVEALAQVEKRLSREVNPVIYWPEEYAAGLASGEGFIFEVHRGSKIMLIGSTDES